MHSTHLISLICSGAVAVLLAALNAHAAFAGNARTSSAPLPEGAKRRTWTADLVKMEEEGAFKALKTSKATARNDPANHGKDKEYEVYRLEDILASITDVKDLKGKNYQVRFTSKDGFQPSAPLDSLLNGHGVVAFREAKPPVGADWSTFDAYGKKGLTVGPYYVFWEDKPYKEGLEVLNVHPWPWQVVRIELFSTDTHKFK